MFIQITIFVELPGSYHPTKQIFVILAQIIVFIIFVVFAVKLAPYHPSCCYSQRFFAIFFKIVVFVIFAVNLAPYHPSSQLHSAIFCNFCQNGCFRHYCWCLWTLSCHCTQQFFVILVKILIFTVFIKDFRPSHALCHCTQQSFCIFHQNCCFHLFHHFSWGL